MAEAQVAEKKGRIANTPEVPLVIVGRQMYLLHWDSYTNPKGQTTRTFRMSAVKPVPSHDGQKVVAWDRDWKLGGLQWDGIGDAETTVRVLMKELKEFNEKATKAKAAQEKLVAANGTV